MNTEISGLLEIFATVFGLTQGILIMLNKRSNWVFYILQIITLFAFSAINHLYGDMINNIIYLIMGIVGAILWSRVEHTQCITKCSSIERVLYVFVIILGTFCFAKGLKNTNDPLPWLDAFSTVSGFVATYYMVKRKLDTWIIWIINDVAYVIEYFMLPNTAWFLLGLNAVWTTMAVLSYLNWNRIMKKDV